VVDEDSIRELNDWVQYASATSKPAVYVVELLMVVDYAIYHRSALSRSTASPFIDRFLLLLECFFSRKKHSLKDLRRFEQDC